MASCRTFSKHPQCCHILHTCQRGHTSQRHHSSSAPKQAYALITRTQVNLLGLILSCCISSKSCITISGCPSFKNLVSFLFHVKMFNCTVLGAIAAIFAATHGRFHQSSSQRASCVFLCLKSGTFHMATTRILKIKLISHVFSRSQASMLS